MTKPLEMTEMDFDPDPDPGGARPALTANRRHHLTMLTLMLIVIALSFALEVAPQARVNFRGLPSRPLPHSCISRSMFGVDCPGCGLTRSFIHLAEGQVEKSLTNHRLGWLLAFTVVLQVPYRIHRLRNPHRGTPKWTQAFSYFLIAALIGNWLLVTAGI